MDLVTLSRFLLCCTLMNYSLLIVWFFVFVVAHDWLQRLHGHWFQLTRPEFDRIHYTGMAGYKVGIMLLNLVPYVALQIIPWR